MAQQATARPEQPGTPDPYPVDRSLRSAVIVFAGGLALHTADHLRRGVGVLTPEVLWGGTVLTVAGVITIAAVLARHRFAAKVAVVVGFYTAISVAASHLLPRWSSLSDAFPGSGVDALSWVAVSVEIAGALALGAAATAALRRGRQPDPRRWH
jgi:hypothetical protein